MTKLVNEAIEEYLDKKTKCENRGENKNKLIGRWGDGIQIHPILLIAKPLIILAMLKDFGLSSATANIWFFIAAHDFLT